MTPYEALANAIILMAVKDYRKSGSEATRREIEAFFHSDWFRVLSPADGKYIIKMLSKEQT